MGRRRISKPYDASLTEFHVSTGRDDDLAVIVGFSVDIRWHARRGMARSPSPPGIAHYYHRSGIYLCVCGALSTAENVFGYKRLRALTALTVVGIGNGLEWEIMVALLAHPSLSLAAYSMKSE